MVHIGFQNQQYTGIFSLKYRQHREYLWYFVSLFLQCGDATVYHLSVYPSGTFRYRDDIGWDTSKIISLPNSLRSLVTLILTWAIWIQIIHCSLQTKTNTKCVQWQKLHDAVVKFDMYRNVQQHHAVLPAIAWYLVYIVTIQPHGCNITINVSVNNSNNKMNSDKRLVHDPKIKVIMLKWLNDDCCYLCVCVCLQWCWYHCGAILCCPCHCQIHCACRRW